MSKKLQKRTFRKRAEIYKPQVLSCPYCGGKAILRPTPYLFGDKTNEGSSDYYYVCTNYPECSAYIKCRKGTFEPMGFLADSWLRHMRNVAHRYIKIIAANRIMRQEFIYYLIAGKLGVREKYAHIRYSTNKNIEEIIKILKGVLDNNHVVYDPELVETPEYYYLKKQGRLWNILMHDPLRKREKENLGSETITE